MDADIQTSVCTFTLDSFKISDTRSLHKDTVYVSIAVAVGSNPAITLPTKSMGDLNNGTYSVNLSIPNVKVSAAEKVAFSYSIINSGHDKDAIEQTLQKVVAGGASKVAASGAGVVGGAVGGPLGSGLAYVGTLAAGWALGKLEGILFANCDGTVAAGDHVFTGTQLARLTADGRVALATDENKGTNSPVGCGGNSHYFVTWSITGHPKTS